MAMNDEILTAILFRLPELVALSIGGGAAIGHDRSKIDFFSSLTRAETTGHNISDLQ